MALEVIVKTKDFNRPTIQAELDALGLQNFAAAFSGFQGTGLDRLEPFPEATRVITRTRQPDGSIQEDSADRGELRIETRNPLTGPELAAVNTTLDDHDASIDDPSQDNDRQTLADVSALRSTFDAGISDPTEEKTVRLLLVEYGEDI